MDNKKIFVMMFMAIFMISMVSAFEFDNVKEYDPITRTATVYDCSVWIGGCLIKGDVISTTMLESPLNVYVERGEDKLVGWFNYQTTNPDVKGTFGDLYLENKKNGQAMSRGRQYKVRISTEESVDDFKLVNCEDVANAEGSLDRVCDQEKVGSHIETVYDWMPITNPNLILKPNTLYQVGIFVDVEEGDHGDWKPTFAGKQIPEWAAWTENLNVDIAAFYNFDDNLATTTFIDATGNIPLTLNTNTNNLYTASGQIDGATAQTGEIGDNFAKTGDGNEWYDTAGEDLTVCFWLYPTASTPYDIYLGQSAAGGHDWFLGSPGSSSKIQFTTINTATTRTDDLSANNLTMNSWSFVCAVVDHTNNFKKVYVDDSVWINEAFTGTLRSTNLYSQVSNYNGNTGNNAFNGRMDLLSIHRRALSTAELTQMYNSNVGMKYTDQFVFAPNITLNSPASANYTTLQTPTINFTVWDDKEVSDVKLYVNDVLNQTNASGLNNTDYLFDLTLGDGNYTIYGKATDNESEETNSSSIQINIDTTPPTITAPTGLNDLVILSLPTNSTWSFNASDPNLDQCYYNTSEQGTTVVTCNSTIQTAWTTQGNKTITSCANDTFGTETCQTDYIWVYYLQETQADNIDPVGEGTEVEFSFLVNLTDIPSTTAYLVLNNTNYAATTSIAGVNAYYFQADVVIPDGWGNSTGNVFDWNWVYNISGIVTNEETDTENITVYALEIDDCSSYGDVILNLSLKDEEEDTYLFPPTANNTDVQVDLKIIATDNSSLSWDYSNTWTDDADGIVQICVPSGVLNNSEYKMEFVMGYSAEDYVQEFYYLDNGDLNADKQYNSLTTDQINLYDLPLDDSTTFLFKFFDEDNIEVKDGVVHTFRKYIGDGEFREVERSKSDNNGETHVHLVEEDVIYYFKISLESEILFTSASYSAKCLSTPCQIDLEASGEFEEFDNNWDLANGSYDVTSDAGTRQVSMLYLLEDPKTMNITVMKYSNNPDTMEVVGSDQAYSTGGILSVTVPQVAGNISFIAVIYEDGEVIDTEWVDFSPSGTDYFGATGIFMALLLIICLILMGSSEGEGTLIFAIIGLILISALKLIDLNYYALVGFICAAVILIWKISERRKR